MTSGLGKIILLGEHAVVYGHAALAGAIDRRVQCRVKGRADELSLRCPDWELELGVSSDHPAAMVLRQIADDLGVQTPLQIETTSNLPRSAGLGSSAAYCVALTRCLAQSMGKSLSNEAVEAVANIGESTFHHRPSGIDVALAVRGGIGLFRRQQGLASVTVPALELAVGLSGKSRPTADMVRTVANKRDSAPYEVDSQLATLGALAEKGADAISSDDRIGVLGRLFAHAQDALASLELSTPEIDELVALALDHGAAGAKLTGGGGGGAVIAVAEDPAAVAAGWRQAGYDAFTTLLGARP